MTAEHTLQLVSSLDDQGATQLPIFDATSPSKPTGEKHRRHKVATTLAEMRRLADELNHALYSATAAERPAIQSPVDAAQLFLPVMAGLEHEELWVMCLNQRNRVISMIKLYQGSVNQSQVRIAELFRQAILDSAVSILIAHNHPSGDPSPSPDDVALTRAVVQAGKLLDIDVLDHLVVGAGRWVSLKERGLGFGS